MPTLTRTNRARYPIVKTAQRKPVKSKQAKKLADVVKKVNSIYRAIEVNISRVEGSTNIVAATNASFDAQIFAVDPCGAGVDPKGVALVQGDDQGQRVGNMITTKRNKFNFVAMIKPWDATTNPTPRPMYLTAWVIKIRGGSYATIYTDVENMIKNYFFQTGNSSQGFSDSVMDDIRPVNTDVFKLLYKKTWKIGTATTMASGGGGATPTSAQGYSNNDFPYSVKAFLDLTKFSTKNIRYNDTSGVNANDMAWLFFTPSNADGSFVGTSIPLEIFYNHQYEYIDL